MIARVISVLYYDIKRGGSYKMFHYYKIPQSNDTVSHLRLHPNKILKQWRSKWNSRGKNTHNLWVQRWFTTDSNHWRLNNEDSLRENQKRSNPTKVTRYTSSQSSRYHSKILPGILGYKIDYTLLKLSTGTFIITGILLYVCRRIWAPLVPWHKDLKKCFSRQQLGKT